MLFKQIVNMISIWFLNEKTVIVKLNFYYQLIFIRVNLTTYPKKKKTFATRPQYFKKALLHPPSVKFSIKLNCLPLPYENTITPLVAR